MPSDDDVLADELGKLGGPGAKWMAKFMPTEIKYQTMILKVPPEKAVVVARSALTFLGNSEEEIDNSPYPILKAFVPAGFLNLNPAEVFIKVSQGDEAGTSSIIVVAAAKEGLIKQQTAIKAVERIAAELTTIAGRT